MKGRGGQPVWLFINGPAPIGVSFTRGIPLPGLIATIKSDGPSKGLVRVAYVDQGGFVHSQPNVILSAKPVVGADYAVPRESADLPDAAALADEKAMRPKRGAPKKPARKR